MGTTPHPVDRPEPVSSRPERVDPAAAMLDGATGRFRLRAHDPAAEPITWRMNECEADTRRAA